MTMMTGTNDTSRQGLLEKIEPHLFETTSSATVQELSTITSSLSSLSNCTLSTSQSLTSTNDSIGCDNNYNYEKDNDKNTNCNCNCKCNCNWNCIDKNEDYAMDDNDIKVKLTEKEQTLVQFERTIKSPNLVSKLDTFLQGEEIPLLDIATTVDYDADTAIDTDADTSDPDPYPDALNGVGTENAVSTVTLFNSHCNSEKTSDTPPSTCLRMNDNHGQVHYDNLLQQQQEWSVFKPSSKSIRTRNPIREIVDSVRSSIATTTPTPTTTANPTSTSLVTVATAATTDFRSEHGNDNKTEKQRQQEQKMISLALGDPTAFGNFPPCPVAVDAIVQAVQSPACTTASYADACGTIDARQAIANFHNSNINSTTCTNHTLTVDSVNYPSYDNVIITNGCSGALEIAITSLLDADDSTVLFLPQPGFPLYQVIAESHGGHVHHYPLLPYQQWEIDIDYLRKAMSQYVSNNHGTARRIIVLINNPSNPTGAVFSKQHLIDVIQLCEEYKACIIADEVYGNIVFDNDTVKFHPIAQIVTELQQENESSTSTVHVHVPVITVSGLAKQFLLPGWRLGWIVFHDNIYGSLHDVKAGAKRLAQLILGSSHLIQAVVPRLLQPTSAHEINIIRDWQDNLITTLNKQAQILCNSITTIPGLQIHTHPMGAMYAMVNIDIDTFDQTITSDIDFTKLLLQEENVFVLPGSCFYPQQLQLQHTNTIIHTTNNTAGSSIIKETDYFFRVVFCAPVDILEEAGKRLRSFCLRHAAIVAPVKL